MIIDECKIENLRVTEPTTRDFQYDIQPQGLNTLIIPYPESILQPAECAYHGVRYEVEVNGSSNTPDFITMVPNGIKIETSDPNDADDYLVSLIVTANGPSTIPAGLEEIVDYDISISACKLADVSVEDRILDFTYFMGDVPSQPQGANFIYDERCELDCTLSVDFFDGGITNPLPYQFDPQECTVTILTD